MKYLYVLLAIVVLGDYLYAQDTLESQKIANMAGAAIICDSLGKPYGEIYIIDSRIDGYLAGDVLVDLFTKQDMIHIDSVRVNDKICRRNDDGISREEISEEEEYYSDLHALIQNRVRKDLKGGGFLVYPEKGLMSAHTPRTLFMVKFQINPHLK